MSLLARELDQFLAICETRSLARAADALGLSQPALSRAVQRLEARLGAQLLVRTPRGVEPTPHGEALRARVERARALLEDAEREVEQLAAGKAGKLRVGAGQLPAELVRRALFPRLLAERPAAKLRLHMAFDAELRQLVGAGALDFAIAGWPEAPPADLAFRALATLQMAVVVRRGHPLTRLQRPTLRDLLAYRGAAPSEGAAARQRFEGHIQALGLALLPHALETNSFDALLAVVASTDAYTMAATDAAFQTAAQARLVALDIPEVGFALRIGVVTRADAYLSPLALRAIELVEAAIAQQGAAPVQPSA